MKTLKQFLKAIFVQLPTLILMVVSLAFMSVFAAIGVVYAHIGVGFCGGKRWFTDYADERSRHYYRVMQAKKALMDVEEEGEG